MAMQPSDRSDLPDQPLPPDDTAAARQETLADLGEWELIRRLGAFAPPGQFADDGALLPLPGSWAGTPELAGAAAGWPAQEPGQAGEGSQGSALVINTDVLVEGIHFSDRTTAAADVGWRAAAANLSDLAAMGCTEVVGITVGLVAPASTPWDWVEGVYGGLREALETYGGVLLGGDCSGGGQRLLAITAIGRLVAPGQPAQAPSPAEGRATLQPMQAARSGEAPDTEQICPPEATRAAEQVGIQPMEPSRGAAAAGIGPMEAARSGEAAAIAGIQPIKVQTPENPSPTAPGPAPGPPRRQRSNPPAPGTAGSGPIRRGDGRPGDLLMCTGPHGLSRLGLALLQGEIVAVSAAEAATGADPPTTARSSGSHPTAETTKAAVAASVHSPTTATPDPAAPGMTSTEAPTGSAQARTHRSLDPELAQRAIAAHRRPRPRFDAVRALIASRPAALPWRVGGCDSSDGLAAAAAAIASSSGCMAQLERVSLPLDAAMAALPEARAWCLAGGEDFELVLALAPAWAEALIAALPGASLIGALVAGEAGALGWADGAPWSEGDGGRAAASGYSHFS